MKVEVRLNEKDFIRFSWFDALRHKKVWHKPALFAAILGAAAGVCFILHNRRGAVLLGCVLLVVALGLPAAWFLSFYLSLRKQAKAAGLSGGKYAYTLELYDDDRGIVVDNGSEHAAYPWEQVFHVYRNETASYLYITPQRAFLIPHDCLRGGRPVETDRTADSGGSANQHGEIILSTVHGCHPGKCSALRTIITILKSTCCWKDGARRRQGNIPLSWGRRNASEVPLRLG